MSASKGISKLRPKTDSLNRIEDFHFINYDESNGLQGKSFNEGQV